MKNLTEVINKTTDKKWKNWIWVAVNAFIIVQCLTFIIDPNLLSKGTTSILMLILVVYELASILTHLTYNLKIDIKELEQKIRDNEKRSIR